MDVYSSIVNLTHTSRFNLMCTASNQLLNLFGFDRRASICVIPSGLGREGAGQVVQAILLLAGIARLIDAREDSWHLNVGIKR